MLIPDVNQCEKEKEQQTHDARKYNIMSHETTTTKNEIFNKMISRFQKEDSITNNRTESLKNENPLPSHFYLKLTLKKEGKPGPWNTCYKLSELPRNKVITIY